MTALYLASYSVGSALGNTIAGGIWVNTMPSHLLNRLTAAGVSNAAEIATSVYADPETFILSPEGAIGTAARTAVMEAYGEVQRYLTIAGLCLSVLLVIATLCLKNPRLGDEQSLEDAEGVEIGSVDSQHGKERMGARSLGESEDNQYGQSGGQVGEYGVGGNGTDKNGLRSLA